MGTRRLLLLAALLLLPSAALLATRRVETTAPLPAAPPVLPGSRIAEQPRTVAAPVLECVEVPGPPGEGEPASVPAVRPFQDAVAQDAWFPRGMNWGRRTFALGTEAMLDPSTGMAPTVPPGRPAGMDIEDFVAAGGVPKEPVVELSGKRKPELEEGVPVSLAGRVVEDAGGAPIAGARVVITSTFYVRRYFYDSHLREVASAVTGADGTWKVERLNVDPAHYDTGGGRGGRLFLTATAEGHAPALAVPVVPAPGGVASRVEDVHLARAAEVVKGRVLDLWEGKPVAGARVFATGGIDPVTYPKDERPALLVGAPATVTDAEGRYRLEGVGTGMQVISVHGGDDCVGRSVVDVSPGVETVLDILTRALRGRIEGTVVDGRGDPVPLVTVEGGGNTTHSFADGRFVLENFRGDAPTVTFSHPDYPPVVLPGVADGTAGLIVRMERPRIAVVLEVTYRGTAAPVKRVQVAFAFAAGTGGMPSTSPERLAANGRYEVRLPEGATALTVAAGGLRTAEVPLAGRADGEVVPVLLAPASE